MILKNLFLLCLGFSLISCAGWRVETTERIGQFPDSLKTESGEKVKIKLNFVSYDHFYNGELKESSLTDTKKQEMMEEIRQVYKDSGIFQIDQAKPDLIADIKIRSEGRGSSNRFILTYATLFLIPSSSETQFTVQTVYKKLGGAVLGEITKQDTVEKWQQLFLIFAMPFKYPHSALKETLVDLNRSVIMDAFKDSVFREAID